MSEWKECKLGELVDKIIDNRGKNPPYSEKGYEIIETSCISGGKKFPDYSLVKKFVSEECYNNWFRAGHPQKDDLLIITVGNGIGNVSIMKETRGAITQNLVGLRINKEKADPNFLYYYLAMNTVQDYLSGLDIGSAQPSLKVPHLMNTEIPLPPLPEQRAIASVLSSLDDKIDLLHRQNKTLEAMAETLFRQWFVEEAETNIIRLGDIVEIFDNERIPLSSMQRDKMKDGKLYPYYGAATIMDYINQYIFEGEYLLLGEDGTVQTEDGFPILQLAVGKFWANNHTHILKAKKPFTNFLLYIILKNTPISHIVTGAVQPKINQENLKSLELEVVNEKQIGETAESVDTFWQKIQRNKLQIHTLEKLRDILLPKLMSGEVRVNV